MTTIVELVERSELTRVGGNLLRHEIPKRAIYVRNSVLVWLEDNLDELQTDGYVPGASTPKQQVVALFRAFIRGDDPSNFMLPTLMEPNENWVWELRTPDLRLFGWFYRRGCFIVTGVNTKKVCVDQRLYGGYRDECVSWRNRSELEPPIVLEGRHKDVF